VDLRYSVTLRPMVEEGGYFAEVPDLPGCGADGDTPIEALDNVCNAISAWITVAKARGQQVPEPTHEKAASGRWLQRVPKTLHRQLAIRARSEGISMNQLVTYLLASNMPLALSPSVTNEDYANALAEFSKLAR